MITGYLISPSPKVVSLKKMELTLNTDYIFLKQYSFQKRKSSGNLDGVIEMGVDKDVSCSFAHELNTSVEEKKTLELKSNGLRDKNKAKNCRIT